MKYIQTNPDIMGGQLVMAGTRFPIATLLFELSYGMTIDEFCDDYSYPRELVENVLRELSQHMLDISGLCRSIGSL